MKNLIRIGAISLAAMVLTVGCGGGDDDDDDGSGEAGSGGSSQAGNGDSGGGSGGSIPYYDSGAGGESGSSGAAGTEGGSGGVTGGAGGGAGTTAGTRREGETCLTADECRGGLICASTGVLSDSICARGCADATTCEQGEVCESVGRGGDKFCMLIEENAYKLCGISYTIACAEPMACLELEASLNFSLCFTICCQSECDPAHVAELNAVACPIDQVCTDIVTFPAFANIGVCGQVKARGEPCDLIRGIVCASGDICSPDDVGSPGGSFSCRQLCSQDNTTCEIGTCIQAVPGDDTSWICYE